ncbi:MAG: hypothetical protein J7L03_06275 [Caldisericaceae bacterium]|nr:hypothetical protein [Caldisericaceae bacterium]
MKKIVLFLVIVSLIFTVTGNLFASNSDSVTVTVSNSLPFSSYKVITFSYTFKDQISQNTKFALFDKGEELPLQILSVTGNTVNFRTVLSLKPLSSEMLILKYGNNIKTNYKNIFAPNFSGTKFVGIGSENLFIVSLKDNNKVKVVRNNGDVIFDEILSEKETKVISLPERDTIFSITSSFPIFAEVSSLKPGCLKNSSDDVSSVFGTYFILYIPKEVVVSSYTVTHLNIKTLSGKTICSKVLPARGQYKNFDLQPGFYEISADNPVTIQFGCEDDNIYAVNYGSLNTFKGVSYGNIVCSALFPNTKIRVKTVNKTYSEISLEKRGDYIYKEVITTFEDEKTETAPIYITYNNPVLIYSDANHGNIGGEQIPSIYGNGRVFSFLTGKIFNFNGLVHRRKVVVIPLEENTSVVVNGKKILLEKALSPRVFLFPKSYTPVSIVSDKPISVFDIGMATSIEFLSMLIPIRDSGSFSIAVSKSGQAPPVGNNTNNGTSSQKGGWLSVLGKYVSPVGAFFTGIFTNAQKVPWIKNIFDTVKEFGASISPYLRTASKQIINLFLPAADMVYPYVHNYLPNLSKEQIAAIIFYLLIVFIIILLIPKRRKKNLPVVKVKEGEEIKKKSQLAFNVKTIEEKSSGVKYGAVGKPKTLAPRKNEPEKEAPTKGTANLPSQAPPFKKPYVKPQETTGKPGLGSQISALYKRPNPSSSSEELKLHKESPWASKKETPVRKPESSVESQGKSPESVAPSKDIKKPLYAPRQKAEPVKSEVQETKEEIQGSGIQGKKFVVKDSLSGGAVESAPEKEVPAINKSETPLEKEVEKKPKTTFARLFRHKVKPVPEEAGKSEPEKKVEVPKRKEHLPQKEVEVSKEVEHPAESAFAKLFKPSKSVSPEPIKEETKKETTVNEPVKPVEQNVKETREEPKKETPIPVRTSLDELLARVKEVSEKQSSLKKEIKEETTDKGRSIEPAEEANVKIKKEAEKLGKVGIRAGSSVVLDRDSVDILIHKGLMKHMGRIFISAKEQATIDNEIKEKYRFGVISLTPIELRIAEDLARRISAKKSTGEILLIAKKVGVKQILVNDDPKIKDYQGIKIINVREIAE